MFPESGRSRSSFADRAVPPDRRRGRLLRIGFLTSLLLLTALTLRSQVPTNGLVAHWPFTGNASDASGNGNNGTVFGATLTHDRFRNARSAYGFDGINDTIGVPHANSLSFNAATSYTISLWVKTCVSDMVQSEGLLTKDWTNPDSGYGYHVGVYQGGRVLGLDQYGGNNAPSSVASINDGEWHHIVLVVSDTVASGRRWVGLYVDNTLDATKTAFVLNQAGNTSNILMGKTPRAALYFNGALDDIRIYNRVITPTEVGYLYNDGGWPSIPALNVNLSLTPTTGTQICRGDEVRFRVTGDADRLTWSTLEGIVDANTDPVVARPNQTTTYKVTAIKYGSDAPCRDSVTRTEEITVTVSEQPDVVVGSPTQYVCSAVPVTLDITTSGGSPPYRWLWSPPTGLSDPTAEDPLLTVSGSGGSYKVVVTDSKGCKDSAEATVIVLPSPEIDLGRDSVHACRGSGGVRIGMEVTGGNGPYVYEWSPAPGLDYVDSAIVRAMPATRTRYIVEVEDKAGCKAYDTIVVIPADPPAANAGRDTALCAGEGALLGMGAGVPGLTYAWSPIEGLDNAAVAQPRATPAATTVYTLTVTDPATGCTAVDQVEVKVRRVSLRADRTSIDFGTLDGCTPGTDEIVRITNDGDTDARLDTREISSPHFSVLGGEIVIPAGGSVEVRVRYAPGSSGSHAGTVTLRGGPCGAEASFTVSGQKEATVVGADNQNVDFGRQLLCEMGPVDTVIRVINSGTSDAEIGKETVGSPYSVVSPVLPATVAAGSTLEVRVRYNPTGAGTFPDVLKLPFTAGECSDTIPVFLSGEVEEVKLEVIELELDFGILDGCTTERDTTIALRNGSTRPITVEGIALPSGYRVLDGLPLDVPAGGTVQVRVRFAPTGTGPANGRMGISYEPCAGTVSLDVRGEKRGVTFTIADTVDFGEVALCAGTEWRLPLDILYRGDGGGDGRIATADVTGPFTTTAAGGTILPDGAAARVEVTFRPTGEGTFAGVLMLGLDPCGVQREVVLTGRAVEAELTATNADFGTVAVGTTRTDAVIFRNTGSATVRVERIEGVIAPFTEGATTPALPADLAPGEELRVEISYRAGSGASISPVRAVVSGPCALTFDGEARGEGSGIARSRIALPRLTARAGEGAMLRLELAESEGLDEIGARRFRAEVSFDASMLAVGDAHAWTDDATGERRRVTITGDRGTARSGELGSVLLTATLGRAETTDLRLESFAWEDALGPVGVDTVHGEFALAGLCREGGLRLYDPRGEVGIKSVSPNPGGDVISVRYGLSEGGATRLHLVDHAGRAVRTIFGGDMVAGEYAVDVDVSSHESGGYWLVLETPTVVLSKRLLILK